MPDYIRAAYESLLEEVREKMAYMSDVSDAEYRKLVEDTVLNCGDLTLREATELIDLIFENTRASMGILDGLVKKDSIQEIMVNGIGDIFYEDRYGIHRYPRSFRSVEELEDLIRNIAAGVHREINEMNPILDARLPNGSRVNAVYKNIAAEGPVLTIRKFSSDRIRIDEMVGTETVTREAADFLGRLVRSRYNLFISGGTSSGKTTFLNALTDYIPSRERVIIIEDSRELMLPNIDNLVQMECHQANSLGKGQVTMQMLIRSSLRMRPDRIIVGEVRGGEVSEMLQAMNTGHDGSMSTGHGNSSRGMLRRIEAMYLAGTAIPMDSIRAQIVEGIDIMVHLMRTSSGKRQVMEIQELTGISGSEYQLNPLFLRGEDGVLERTGNRLRSRHKLILAGEREEES